MSKYRLVAMVMAADNEDGQEATQRRALPDDIPDFWAVQEKDSGKWYTVDTFEDSLDAEEFLQQLLDSGEEDSHE